MNHEVDNFEVKRFKVVGRGMNGDRGLVAVQIQSRELSPEFKILIRKLAVVKGRQIWPQFYILVTNQYFGQIFISG